MTFTRRIVAAAGLVYLLAWIIGLSVWPTNPSVRATGPQILAALHGHVPVAIAQYVCTQGIAGVALAVVVSTFTGWSRITGLLAAAVSLTQCALGVHLSGWLSTGPADSSHTFFALVNRLDGMKMLLLAATALLVSVPALRDHIGRAWIHRTGIALAVTISISGIGYLLLSTTLAPAAYISGIVLLIWVPAIAWTSRDITGSAVENTAR
ncbi:hypothetical protein KO481_16100 [Nocardia sp. NEAU-G5]|uniref:DUF998 domain-containing protein n=1 Tax=Nocardia albiluteola TaxID=2842303 RepID=A0ABS6AYD3_9NOCA|nr:hypothetical protein [Nocardia albiluteola]MBU3063042.1 hypothetical protein [Nocardia albiluteola]